MKKPVCWIDTEGEDTEDPGLRDIYEQVRGPDGKLDNLYQAFSLRAHTILPADDLYKAALHNENNTLPKCFSELVGTYVAILSGCEYASTHHGHNYRHLSGDAARASTVLENLVADDLEQCGNEREVAALRYVKKLCQQPQGMSESDIKVLESHNWLHGEILEIVQVVAMFSYFTRVINGVGIKLGDDRIGLY